MTSVSMIMLTYNHERFVQEAIESALAQSHPDLELVISDDQSTDRTWLVVTSVVEAYKGPAKIVINRNPTNLGLVPNYNKAVAMSHGEIIVAAAGDDVSYRHRVASILSAFQTRPDVMLVYSECSVVDEHGRPQGMFYGPSYKPIRSYSYLRRTREFGVLGAVIAVRRRVFDVYGPLPSFALMEDCSVVYRAKKLGDIDYINHPLLSYRVHANRASRILAGLEHRAHKLKFRQNAVDCLLLDSQDERFSGIHGRLLAYRAALAIEEKCIHGKISPLLALIPFTALAGLHQSRIFISRYIVNKS